MVGVLILTHGGLASELLASAEMISGKTREFEALALDWNDRIEEIRHKVEIALMRLDHGDGVLILTDIYGSTPSNVAKQFQKPGHIETVSGVNLPMVVRLGCLDRRQMPVREMANWIRTKGQASICSSCEMPPCLKNCDETE